MTSQFKRALLAAGLTTVAALAAAPGAQAGWMTGSGTPPVWTTEDPCRNGMIWTYGTFLSGAWPPSAPHVTIYDHALVKMGQWDPPQEPLVAANVVSSGTYTVPLDELVLPSWFMLIPPDFYPVDASGNHRVNKLDYSRTFHFKFKNWQPAGTGLRKLWRSTATQPYIIRTGTYYQVANCWIATVMKAPIGVLKLYISGAGAAVGKAEAPTMRVATRSGHATSSSGYAEDVDRDSIKDLVLEFEGVDKPRCDPGDPVVVSQTVPPPGSPGC
jgi:hypothetical protein